MKLLDLTLPTLAENLALEEALLEAADRSASPNEVLRLWESPQFAVIIGRASRVEEEVNVPFCRQEGIPILRRCSGGTAVVIGPGCFLYGVVLDCEKRPSIRMVDHAHRLVLNQLGESIRRLGVPVDFEEPCDLTWNNRKISGNSLRCKRQSLLYHGTVLYDFANDLISRCLRFPPRQPTYRQDRPHTEFVINAPLRAAPLRESLSAIWEACERLDDWPRDETSRLARERYARDEWTFRI
jgi:lipoate-protein ligase A